MGGIAMSVSDAKLQANAANAQLSTGPKTAEGKARSSRNAIKLGMFCKKLLVGGEDPAELKAMREGMLRRLNPRDALELAVVEQIVTSHWKLRRLTAAEHEAFREQEHLCVLDYQIFRHANGEPRVEDDQLPPPGVGMMMWRMLKDDQEEAVLEKISRHAYRLNNTIRRCMSQLQQLQERAEIEQPASALVEDLLQQQAAQEQEKMQNEPTADEQDANRAAGEELYRTLSDYRRAWSMEEEMKEAYLNGRMPSKALEDEIKVLISEAEARNKRALKSA
jgi:hypothetical protein